MALPLSSITKAAQNRLAASPSQKLLRKLVFLQVGDGKALEDSRRMR